MKLEIGIQKIKGRIKFTCTCPDGTGTGEASGKDIGGGVMVVRDHPASEVIGSEPTDTNDVHISYKGTLPFQPRRNPTT